MENVSSREPLASLRHLTNTCRTIVCLFTATVFLTALSSAGTQNSDGDGRLANILAKAADYCQRLESMSVQYVSREEVLETIRSRGRIRKKTHLLYNYSLYSEGERIEETRFLVKENDDEVNITNAELKTALVLTKSVYGPSAMLNRFWQNHYRYEWVKEDEIDGVAAIVVDAIRKPVADGADAAQMSRDMAANATIQNWWNMGISGRIWFDRQDASVMRIELDPESFLAHSDEYIKPEKISLDFQMKRNGIRFPTATNFRAKAYQYPRGEIKRGDKTIYEYGGSYTDLATKITYSDYRFTDIKVEFGKVKLADQ